MTHTTEIVEVKQVADELFSIRVRCCGDEITDSWHTMHSSVVNDDTKLAVSLQWKHAKVAENHEAAQRAKTVLVGLVGSKVQHGS